MTRNYVQIGAGGTGSFLFPALFRYLTTYKAESDEAFSITVIDGKEVAPSKLHRQLFFDRFAGENKATALVRQYESDPSVVIAVPDYLGEDNIDGIAENDVVLICADNFPTRARVERHGMTLENLTVINGGNELIDGSLQTWIRRDGQNVTPPLSQGHPEILREDPDDPSTLSCTQIAELPGGQQTIVANMMSATAMLNAVRQLHRWEATHNTDNAPVPPGEEVFFDMDSFAMRATTRPNGAPA